MPWAAMRVAALVYCPLPLSATINGLPLPLSLICRLAVSAPAAPGVNVSEMVQLAPAARLLPQVFAEIPKSPGSAPTIEIVPKVNVVLRVFVMVTV